MRVVKSVRVLDNTFEFQLFPIEITYIKDGQEVVRLTSATEVIELFEAAQQQGGEGAVENCAHRYVYPSTDVCRDCGELVKVPRR
jgi:hypothetical protein